MVKNSNLPLKKITLMTSRFGQVAAYTENHLRHGKPAHFPDISIPPAERENGWYFDIQPTRIRCWAPTYEELDPQDQDYGEEGWCWLYSLPYVAQLIDMSPQHLIPGIEMEYMQKVLEFMAPYWKPKTIIAFYKRMFAVAHKGGVKLPAYADRIWEFISRPQPYVRAYQFQTAFNIMQEPIWDGWNIASDWGDLYHVYYTCVNTGVINYRWSDICEDMHFAGLWN